MNRIQFIRYKKGKMLNFTGSLNEDSGAFAIFVNEKYRFNDKKKILTEASTKKINSL